MRSANMKMVAFALCMLVLAGCSPLAGSSSSKTHTPTATIGQPSATPTTEQRVITLVQQAIGKNAKQSTTAYDGATETVSVIATVATFSGVTAAQEIVKVLCFRVQEALWTSGIPLMQVNVTVEGPVHGVYGDLTTSGYGGALLNSGTAARLAWTALSPDSAWADYNDMWLTPTYDND